MLVCGLCLMTALAVPASALEYSVEAPGNPQYAKATSVEPVYTTDRGETPNVDMSKNAALVPPGFGTATSYLPGSGEPLTPNLAGEGAASGATINGSTVAVFLPDGGQTVPPSSLVMENIDQPVTVMGYTAVTDDLYYSGGYLATLKIPTLGVKVKVYQGTGSSTLAKGAGHFEDTSVWDGNVAIAGHNRGVNCYFGDIHTLSLGDKITLTTKLGTRTYAVTSVNKISETDNSLLAPTAENCVTLFTCVRGQSAYRWAIRAVEVK